MTPVIPKQLQATVGSAAWWTTHLAALLAFATAVVTIIRPSWLHITATAQEWIAPVALVLAVVCVTAWHCATARTGPHRDRLGDGPRRLVSVTDRRASESRRPGTLETGGCHGLTGCGSQPAWKVMTAAQAARLVLRLPEEASDCGVLAKVPAVTRRTHC